MKYILTCLLFILILKINCLHAHTYGIVTVRTGKVVYRGVAGSETLNRDHAIAHLCNLYINNHYKNRHLPQVYLHIH